MMRNHNRTLCFLMFFIFYSLPLFSQDENNEEDFADLNQINAELEILMVTDFKKNMDISIESDRIMNQLDKLVQTLPTAGYTLRILIGVLTQVSNTIDPNLAVAKALAGTGKASIEIIGFNEVNLKQEMNKFKREIRLYKNIFKNLNKILKKHHYTEAENPGKLEDFSKMDCSSQQEFLIKWKKRIEKEQALKKSIIERMERFNENAHSFSRDIKYNSERADTAWKDYKINFKKYAPYQISLGNIGLDIPYSQLMNDYRYLRKAWSDIKKEWDKNLKEFDKILTHEKRRYENMAHNSFYLFQWDPCTEDLKLEKYLAKIQAEKYIASHDQYLLIEVNGRLDTFTNLSIKEISETDKVIEFIDLINKCKQIPHYEVQGTNQSDNITVGDINLSGLQKVFVPKGSKKWWECMIPLISGMPKGGSAGHQNPEGVNTYSIQNGYLIGKIVNYSYSKGNYNYMTNAWFRVKLEDVEEKKKVEEVVADESGEDDSLGEIIVEINGEIDTFEVVYVYRTKFHHKTYYATLSPINWSNEEPDNSGPTSKELTKDYFFYELHGVSLKQKFKDHSGSPLQQVRIIVYEDLNFLLSLDNEAFGKRSPISFNGTTSLYGVEMKRGRRLAQRKRAWNNSNIKLEEEKVSGEFNNVTFYEHGYQGTGQNRKYSTLKSTTVNAKFDVSIKNPIKKDAF